MSNFCQLHSVSLSVLQVLWIEDESVVHFSDSLSDFEEKVKVILVQNKIAPTICTPDKYPESWTGEILAEKLGDAHNCLILHLKDNVLREINETHNIYEIWTKLEKLYLVKSLSNKIHLKEQLFGFKM
ncbi:hypothetical protein M9H77_02029 [Catharanthus roseus]|uniref:Uncharacterized protein n=1 Tax=Catharanthus roseus TaxID=4058 RepID=A0ACC0C7I3_CATRO|nr:hypothetical protein M9H77_02029 [Catharanthus roseus]